MKLRNKKTGEMAELCSKQQIYEDKAHLFLDTKNGRQYYASLTELNEEWEDVPEEPKDYYVINLWGEVSVEGGKYQRPGLSELGLTFETKEEAEKAVEKLKAWKRLKDKGFRFSKDWVYRYDQPFVKNHTYLEFVAICEDGVLFDDLDLLFGGEE